MWWWIGGAVVVALIIFVCWIVWEIYHDFVVDDVLAGFTLDDDDEEDESEDAFKSREI